MAYGTWETKGPVSTPSADDRKSCVCGSALPSGPTATIFISAKPGMVAKLSVDRSNGQIVEAVVQITGTV